MPLRANQKPWSGTLSRDLRRATLARDYDAERGYTPCHWCGKPADTADHWPISRNDGGPDELNNLVSACKKCNFRRGGIEGNKIRWGPKPSRQW